MSREKPTSGAPRILFCFIVLRHDRRQPVHLNVTAHPTAEWATRQIIEAFPYEDAPKYLLRDRDCIYSQRLVQLVRCVGIREVITSPRSSPQNPYTERTI